MIKRFKDFTLQLMAGANVVTIIVMLIVGYSDRLHPADHPALSTLGMTFPIFLAVNLVFLLFWLLFKWTKAWIPVVGFLCAYVPISIYMPLNVTAVPTDDAIKVVSYNVCGYAGNHKYDNALERICDYLREQQPDIVCLQEDTRGQQDDYTRLFPYNDTIRLRQNGKSTNAVGIHTRYPIIRREHIDYESATNGSGAWWLRIAQDTVIVVNNHFESCHLTAEDRQQYRQIIHGEIPSDSVRSESQVLLVKLAEANAKRSRQIDTVLRYIRRHSRYPIILCGDFNDNPISYSHYAMRQELTDCFIAAGCGIGLSYSQRAFSFRIDHILCSDAFHPTACEIDRKMDASDHYPVLAWLKKEGKQ